MVIEATILYAKDMKGPLEEIGSVEVQPAKPMEILGRLFEQFNIGDRGGLRIRSMSVGDAVRLPAYVCEDGTTRHPATTWRCDPCGWSIIPTV